MPTGYCALYARTHHVVTSCAKHVLFTHAAARAIQPNLNNDHIARSLRMSIAGQYRGAGHHSVHVHGSFNSVRCAQYTRHRNNLIVLHIAHNMQVCTWRVMCPDRSPQRKVRTVAARASLGAGTVPDARRRTPMCLVTNGKQGAYSRAAAAAARALALD
jgi:hypothetical protein